ncbi:MAG: pyridoxamine 5'-phosphate oxidase family protein [Acidobacteriota bacterium]
MADPTEFYTAAQRELQEKNDSTALAQAMATSIVFETLGEKERAFIGSRDFFFLSTVNEAGEPTVSYKGGAPGFVQIVDDATLRFPAYDGNGMFLSLGNAAETGKIGMLFIDFEVPHRLRVQGSATLSSDPSDLAGFPGALAVVEVRIDHVFVNCARYIHRHTRQQTSRYVPDGDGEQPYPSWKRIDALQPVLPAADQGRAEREGGTISVDEYQEKLVKGES